MPIKYLALAALFALLTVNAAAADLLSGTWKQNVAKSKYNPGPPFKNNTTTFELFDGGMNFSADGIDGRGRRIQNEYTVQFDGKDYPTRQLVDGKPNTNGADAVSWKKIDDYTYEQTNKYKGKMLTVARHVISKDGKTRVVNTTGMNIQGERLNNVLVFEKQ
jgi:hypothetical protein